jgi:GT2 family glycosyltransferase
MLLRAPAFRSVGGFDPGYFLYWEDADLCRRLTDDGWGIAYEPAAVVHHATGASGTSERTIGAFHDSAARFAARYIARNRFERQLMSALLGARRRLVLAAYRRRAQFR